MRRSGGRRLQQRETAHEQQRETARERRSGRRRLQQRETDHTRRSRELLPRQHKQHRHDRRCGEDSLPADKHIVGRSLAIKPAGQDKL